MEQKNRFEYFFPIALEVKVNVIMLRFCLTINLFSKRHFHALYGDIFHSCSFCLAKQIYAFASVIVITLYITGLKF